jgi:hypothetical protein
MLKEDCIEVLPRERCLIQRPCKRLYIALSGGYTGIFGGLHTAYSPAAGDEGRADIAASAADIEELARGH